MIDLQCPHCGATVTGYSLKIKFIFVSGVRESALKTVELGCGCEFLDPEIDVAGEELSMVDRFSGDRILTFKDAA